jgi:hypothetical protein
MLLILLTVFLVAVSAVTITSPVEDQEVYVGVPFTVTVSLDGG